MLLIAFLGNCFDSLELLLCKHFHRNVSALKWHKERNEQLTQAIDGSIHVSLDSIRADVVLEELILLEEL